VALCLGAMKIARLTAAPGHRDSWIDLAGYAACGAAVAVRLGLQWEKPIDAAD
jgi:uncharacterized protein DUF6378